jgi:hypothetical protein
MGIKTTINESIGTVTWTATDGASVTIHLERLHPSNKAYAALHGLKQKCGDAAAIGRSEVTGKSADDGEKLAAIREVVDHLESGSAEWNRKGSGGGGDSALVAAICQALGKTDSPELRAKVRAYTPAQRLAMQQHPSVKPFYDAILAKRAESIDAEDLLAGL